MVTRGIRSMVIGPGGCRFSDSWRLGLPLLVLVPLGLPLLVLVPLVATFLVLVFHRYRAAAGG
jgi:di/tricarboxylate transporter